MSEDLAVPSEPLAGARTVLEQVVVAWPLVPRRAWDHLFATGRVRRGGRPVSPRAAVGDPAETVIHGGLAGVETLPTCAWPAGLRVLEETPEVLTLAKPPGLPVVPGRGDGPDCFSALLGREVAARSARPLAEWRRPRIVHRIDRATSGLLVVARTADVERRLGRLFEESRVEKLYIAALDGRVVAARTTVVCPIGPGRSGTFRVTPSGRPATTVFEVIARARTHTLVCARPRTGRTHQIRVHARAFGHAVAGDPLYAPTTSAPGLEPGRLALHAWRYRFADGGAGRRDEVYECPLPEDLRRVVDGWLANANAG